MTRDVDRLERVYRRLLVLYPEPFRDEYGGRMVQAFGDQLRRGDHAAALWTATLKDLVVSASIERMEAGMRRSSGIALGIVFAVAAVAAIFVTGTDGVGMIEAAVVGIGLVGVVVLAALVINRFVKRPTEATWGSWAGRNWWAVPAALLPAYYVWVAFEGGLATVALSLAFAGLIVTGLWLRSRREGRLGAWLVLVGVLPALVTVWFIPAPIAALLALIGAVSELMLPRRAEPRIPGVQS